MESFLEANRVVESSLLKLRRPAARGMSLRDALLVSSAMSRAQEVASNLPSLSPSSSPFSSPSSSSSSTVKASRLLASMRAPEEDSAVSLLLTETVPATERLNKSTAVASPLSLSSNKEQAQEDAQTQEDEVMEFISNSVLSDILKEDETDMEVASSPSWTPSPLSDVSNTRSWSPWTKKRGSNGDGVTSLHLSEENGLSWPEETLSPPSPGKRHHAIAFPSDLYSSPSSSEDSGDVTKRFKSSDQSLSPSYSLGFSDFSRTFSTTPLITFMCGTEFTRSGTNSSWPASFSGEQDKTELSGHHNSLSPSKLYSVLAY